MLRSAAFVFSVALVVSGQTQTKHGPAPITSPQMNMGVFAVASDREGTLFIDGERKTAILADKIVTLQLTAGQHFAELRDAKGAKLWEKVVNIPSGTQTAERIILNSPAIVSGSTQKVDTVAELTPCEVNHLFARYQDAFAACRQQDDATVRHPPGSSAL
jgi:hypothetical protein